MINDRRYTTLRGIDIALVDNMTMPYRVAQGTVMIAIQATKCAHVVSLSMNISLQHDPNMYAL